MAQAGRAKLILEYEQAEVSQIRRIGKGKLGSTLAEKMNEKDKQRLGLVCPRWLHVLMPASHQRGEEGDQAEELKQIKELRRKVEAMEASMEKRSQKVLDAVGKRDAKEERARLMQAFGVEMGKMREALSEDVKQQLEARLPPIVRGGRMPAPAAAST